jgi:hypothetical protein
MQGMSRDKVFASVEDRPPVRHDSEWVGLAGHEFPTRRASST